LAAYDKAPRRRPGPVAGLCNPAPGGDGFEGHPTPWISPQLLDDSEQCLRRYLVGRRKELRRYADESLQKAAWRIEEVGQRAVEETGAAWWSARVAFERKTPAREPRKIPSWRWSQTRNRFWAAPHVGPSPPSKRPADRSPWIDTSADPPTLRVWRRERKEWVAWGWFAISGEQAHVPETIFDWAWTLTEPTVSYDVRWPFSHGLRPAAIALISGKTGRAGRSGRPAYLAYAILGTLLRVSPERIADTLNHYRPTPSKSRSR